MRAFFDGYAPMREAPDLFVWLTPSAVALSGAHASILLREAGRPAIVDCTGIYKGIAQGDGGRGVVEVLI